MHISEGVLNTPIIISSTLMTLSALYICFKKLNHEQIPFIAIFSALFFIASFIHVPLGPSSVHLILNGVIGVFLGLYSFIAIFIALFFQALMFGYGGISTLGINTLIMALPALISFFIYSKTKHTKFKQIGYFFVGFLSIFFSSILLCLTLILNGDGFLESAKVIFGANIVIMIVEGFITMFALNFLKDSNLTKRFL